EKGARSVRALITHPVLSGNAYENIENSILEELVVCDTIPIDKKLTTKIKVLTVSELFAIAIRNAYENKSITSLFVHSQRKGCTPVPLKGEIRGVTLRILDWLFE